MAKRKSTKTKAANLKQEITSTYWWDLSTFQKYVRNEFEYLVAVRVMNSPEDMSLEEYNEYLRTEQAQMHAQDDMDDCDKTRELLRPHLTEDKIAEANKLAVLIFEM